MPITRIIPEIRSQDVAATEDLYCNILGLAVGMSDESGFRSFNSPDQPSAQIIVNDNDHIGLPPGFAIDVGEPGQVDAVHEAIVARGLPVIEPLVTKPWVSDGSPSSTTTANASQSSPTTRRITPGSDLVARGASPSSD